MPIEMTTLAARFFAAVAAGDIESVRAAYAQDAVIWHNYDGESQTVEENLRVLSIATRIVHDWRYEDVHIHETTSGFVQQHVLRGRTAAGVDLEVPACIVCTVVEGSITRLEEYFDSAHLAPLRG